MKYKFVIGSIGIQFLGDVEKAEAEGWTTIWETYVQTDTKAGVIVKHVEE